MEPDNFAWVSLRNLRNLLHFVEEVKKNLRSCFLATVVIEDSFSTVNIIVGLELPAQKDRLNIATAELAVERNLKILQATVSFDMVTDTTKGNRHQLIRMLCFMIAESLAQETRRALFEQACQQILILKSFHLHS